VNAVTACSQVPHSRELGSDEGSALCALDQVPVIDGVLSPDADCSCELSSPHRDLMLRLRGSGPGLQFYNGQFLARSHPHLGNGVILEPQGLPDAPNHSHFPDSILRPGEHYRAEIEYRVSA
jgi:aldose 1-epimerase